MIKDEEEPTDLMEIEPDNILAVCQEDPKAMELCQRPSFLEQYQQRWDLKRKFKDVFNSLQSMQLQELQEIQQQPPKKKAKKQSIDIIPRPLPKLDYDQTYRTIKILGEGKYGNVVLVQQRFTLQFYAVKFIPANSVYNEKLFQIELSAWQKVSKFPHCHDHVVCLQEYRIVYRNRKRFYAFVMEHLPNSMDLFDYMVKIIQCKPSPAILRQMISQLGQGLKHIHEQGVFHRDIKPENIMVQLGMDRPKFKYIDFGLSCTKGHEFCQVFGGTPEYMDKLLAKRFIGLVPKTQLLTIDDLIAADIYALGTTLYKVVLAQHPYKTVFNQNDNNDMILYKIARSSSDDYPKALRYMADPKLAEQISGLVVEDRQQRIRNFHKILNASSK